MNFRVSHDQAQIENQSCCPLNRTKDQQAQVRRAIRAYFRRHDRRDVGLPANQEISGNLSLLNGLDGGVCSQIRTGLRWQFPANRENILKNREFLSGNREFHCKARKRPFLGRLFFG